MADTEQEGAPSATAGGASAPILDLSAFEKAGRLLAAAWLEQQAARAAYWRGLFGGLSANQEPHAMQEVDRSTCPNCWGDLPPDPRDAEIERLRAANQELNAHLNRIGSPAFMLELADLRQDLADARTSYDVALREGNEARESWKRADAETDRLRGELCQIRDIALVVLNVLPDDDDRSAVDLVREILQTVGPGALGRDKQFSALVAERHRKRRELADVTADRDRWQALYNQLIGDALHVQQHLQRATDMQIHPSDQFDKDFSRSVVDELKAELDGERQLRAEITSERDNARQERNRLRQELDLVGEQHAAGLVTLRTDFTAAVNGLLPKPAKPRRWVAGDPEPEIGVTVRRISVADYDQRWTRMPNGSWHPNHACQHGPADQCSGLVFAEWKQLPRPLVEVVNSDG